VKYHRQLSDQEIAAKFHREFVGGRWDELGRLQFEFLRRQGLAPNHRLLDVGCGALRGGLHFIRYLEPGNYYGVDMNPSLLRAGVEVELAEAGLQDRRPRLRVDETFDFAAFGTTFHFAIAQSVFTHLSINSIERCLVQMARVLEPGDRFYATIFEAPTPHYLDELPQRDGQVSHSDRSPFHYHFSVFPFLVSGLPLSVKYLGEWGHPRGQRLLEFTRTGSATAAGTLTSDGSPLGRAATDL
jgi:SAM-dependent methyltransferase